MYEMRRKGDKTNESWIHGLGGKKRINEGRKGLMREEKD